MFTKTQSRCFVWQVEQLKEEICEYQRSERPEPPPAEGVRTASLQVFPSALFFFPEKQGPLCVSMRTWMFWDRRILLLGARDEADKAYVFYF